MFEKIRKWYIQSLWSEGMVQDAVGKGVLTAQEAEKIQKEKNDGKENLH